jgi:hypothetical protein
MLKNYRYMSLRLRIIGNGQVLNHIKEEQISISRMIIINHKSTFEAKKKKNQNSVNNVALIVIIVTTVVP